VGLKKLLCNFGRVLSPLIPRGLKLPILRGKLKSKTWVFRAGTPRYWLGIYESRKRTVFEKTVTKGSVVFDVGAHVGFYTLLASELVGPAGRVFAFEPSPRNLQYLTAHLELNDIANATVVKAAVSDRSGFSLFEKGMTPTKGRIASGGGLRVKTVSLDEAISAGELPVPQYIKMDVEGGELLALRGVKSILASAHPTLFLSTHGPTIHRQCLDLLESVGYTLRPVVGTRLERTDQILAYRD